jgi:hypothetical protein
MFVDILEKIEIFANLFSLQSNLTFPKNLIKTNINELYKQT